MNKRPPNAAVIELARVFLQFEIEKRAEAASQVSEARDAATATNQVTEATRQVNHTPARRIVKPEV